MCTSKPFSFPFAFRSFHDHVRVHLHLLPLSCALLASQSRTCAARRMADTTLETFSELYEKMNLESRCRAHRLPARGHVKKVKGK
ncbi:hypothetical protein FA10DRAFT_16229 [Acaromyces ingoldii]|uniref:Uncharacterized protein n=1 Tax=Acaromyces ingoldii TaxID=215250 RepID=A0A316YVD1_9BASI|nr:hypothetical protein FA10DRAFT_16229 [Acaromyces ingoldii]PWN93211.1 hypothetical protein FA10DRAFT_16229 [Acaromyces ingoldii]